MSLSDFNNLTIVTNNYELDSALTGVTAKPACIVNINDWIGTKPLYAGGRMYAAYTKPVGASMKYISQRYIPAGESSSHTFEKKKGYSSETSISMDMKASVGANIMGCDVSMEVSTGFSYTHGISNEITESWTDTVQGPNTFYVYQPVILYCTRVTANEDTRAALGGISSEVCEKNGELFFFVTVFRNAPQTTDRGIDPVRIDDFKRFLLSNDGWNSWYTDITAQGRGAIRHDGLGKFVVAHDSTGGRENGNELLLWSDHGSQTPMGNDFNKFILLDGHLFHQGLGKAVVAKDSTGGTENGNPLVLWDSFGSQTPMGNSFNKFHLTAQGHLYHQGTGKYVVAKDSTGGTENGNPLVLWDSFGSQTPMGDNFNRFTFDGT